MRIVTNKNLLFF